MPDPAADNAKIDVHATDPQRLKFGEDEKASDEIERRMSRLQEQDQESKKRVETLEAKIKALKEQDPKDDSGAQAVIK